MYHGPYMGTAAEKQPKRILILGESHHDIPPTMTTQQVVDGYLEGKHVQFFRDIANAFGIYAERAEEKALFWDKVFFGNYIDISLDGPSGEGDQTAEKLIVANKDRYNQQLAEFIKANQIDKIFCFSFRTFDKGLPVAPTLIPDVFKKVSGSNINLWCGRAYGPDPLFGQNVEIYGIPHPRSWVGFGPEDIVGYLKPVFEDCCK